MKLKKLTLTNFQGVRNFILGADGKDVSVLGENSTGKTTIYNSFCFLLYGLDSQGKTFLPKPINAEGEAKHGVSSEVEGIFLFDDGNEITLKKEYKELWVKKYGAAKKIFSGHTTKHFWDSVPISEKEYKKRLAEIAPERVFKLLTNVRYFSEDLHWQERRSILLDVCGDISDADIIASDKNLSSIVEILDGKSLEDQKKIIASQKAILNKELEALPIRINENEKGLPDITGLNSKAIEKVLEELSKALTQKNEEAARIEAGGEIAEKIKKQREIEGELLGIENQVAKDQGQVEAVAGKKLAEMEDLKFKNERQLKEILFAIEARTKINECAKKDIASLKKEWHEINDSVFNEGDVICPTCKQEYPGDKAQEIQERFNTKKAEKLDNINKSGKLLVGSIKDRSDQGEVDRAEVTIYEGNIKELTKTIDDLKKTQDPETGPPKENKKQEALALDLTELKLNINGLRANSHEALEKVQAEILAISEKRIAAGRKQQTLESHKRGQKRIKELSDQQRVTATRFEELEADLFVMDEFIRQKVRMLESKVNEMFKMAKFKLFNVLVNGGLEECCEVTYNGIGYSSGLNNGARINVGLDITDTLSEFYGLNLVIFIDNSESVTELIPSESQIIRLVVDEKYSKLTVK